MSDDEVLSHLYRLPFQFALTWCDADVCGCMGCANFSGGLSKLGVTKEQWLRAIRLAVKRADDGAH